MENNRNAEAQYVEPRDIDILVVLSYVIRKWKNVFITAVIVAALGSGFSYYSEYKKTKDKYSTTNIENVKEKLKESEIKQVEEIYAGYDIYNKELDKIQRELDESPALNEKYTNVLSVNYSYYSDYCGLKDLLAGYAFTEEDYEKFAVIYGIEAGSEYLTKMISFGGSEVQNEYQIDTDGLGELLGNGRIVNKYSGNLTVSIITKSEEQGSQLYDIVNAALLDRIDEIKKSGIDIEFKQTNLLLRENVRENQIGEIRKEKVSEKTEIIGEQIKFYEENVEKMDSTKKTLFDLIKGSNENDEVKEVDFELKNVVFFGFVGAILAVLIIAIKWVGSGKIGSKAEVQRYTKAYVIACIKNRKKRILFSSIADRMAAVIDKSIDVEEGKEALEVLTEKVYRTVEKEEAKNVFIASQISTKKEEEILDEIKSKLKKEKIDVTYGNPYKKVEISEKFYEADSIIMLATIEKTSIKFVEELRADCSKVNGKFAGSVILYS